MDTVCSLRNHHGKGEVLRSHPALQAADTVAVGSLLHSHASVFSLKEEMGISKIFEKLLI